MELAWSEYYAQELDTAIGVLNDIVETNPNNSRALFQLGFSTTTERQTSRKLPNISPAA